MDDVFVDEDRDSNTVEINEGVYVGGCRESIYGVRDSGYVELMLGVMGEGWIFNLGVVGVAVVWLGQKGVRVVVVMVGVTVRVVEGEEREKGN